MEKVMICALMPHPPIMIPEIGKGELDKIKDTVASAEKVAKMITDENPQTIVLITPHGPAFKDAVSISIHPRLKGNFGAFGAPDVSLGFETDDLLTRHILKKTTLLGINLIELTDDMAKDYRISLNLDHGALVPLYYLHKAGFKGQLVHISVGMLSYEEMYTFGKAVQMSIGSSARRVAVIASGDLSHRLIPSAPAGYSARAGEFDKQVLQAVKDMNVKGLFNIDPDLVEEAGECGLRPIFFLMGVVGGMEAAADLLSYEAPFGVGYAVAVITAKNKSKEAGGEKNED